VYCLIDKLLSDLDNFMNRLSKAAEEDGLRLFLVGGSVRDEMLGRPIRDLDLATDAPVERIKGLIAAARPDSL